MVSLNKQMSASTSKKRKLSVDPAPALTEDEEEAPAKRQKLDVEEEVVEVRRGGGATRRQQDVKLKLEEKEKKEKEKGPGWYYELVPVKKPRFVISLLCNIISISSLLQCRAGGCSQVRTFHWRSVLPDVRGGRRSGPEVSGLFWSLPPPVSAGSKQQQG